MKKHFVLYAPYWLLTAVIMLPLLLPGYILTLDLVFTPVLRAPQSVSNDWLWQNLLHYLSLAVPSQLIEKAILVSIPLLSGIGMHRLITYLRPAETKGYSWYWATYIAGILYTVNPFTYSRFMAGQYAVLLGYALLPWFVSCGLRFIDKPRRATMLRTTAFALLISIISIHAIGEMLLISAALAALALWQTRYDAARRKQLLILCGQALVIFALLSAYWLVPLVAGQGNTAHTVQQFNSHDTSAFATAGDNMAERIANVLRLQGFWAESRDLFTLPQEQLAGWGTIRLIIWLLVGWGAVAAWRDKRRLAAALAVLGLISIVLSIGLPDGLLTTLGYREPQKFVGLLALVFAIFAAFGSARLLYLARNRSEGFYNTAACILLIAVILFTPTMYWGFGGQLQPRHYPASWAQANDWLHRDQSRFSAVALPWHEYMSFKFSGRIIGNPAQDYFDTPVIISHDPGLGKLGQPQSDSLRRSISRILARHDHNMARELAGHNVKYLLLAKDFDYQKYDYLAHQPGFAIAWNSPELTIFRNLEGGE